MMRNLRLVPALLLAGVVLAQPSAAQARRGSIYDVSQGPFGLVCNKTARHVGDLVTIVISETQDLKAEETSDLGRVTNLNYALTSFNIKPNAFDPLPDVRGESEDTFRGTANYQKKGNFTARVTAVVIDTLPNGNLVVRGRREIKIDNETKLIEFSGILRKYDVKPDNSVASELVADAQVTYIGNGPLTKSTNRYGVGRFVHDAIGWIWPF
jgi:flagellar L-ring protein precursor FlgH